MEWFLTLLIIKHFVCDFPLQYPRHYLNKGIYAHRGGIEHAGIQGLGTLIVCALVGAPIWYALVDFVIHYHVDWSKNQLNAKWQLKPDNKYFWWLLGIDQLAHYLTYAWMVAA